MKLDSVCDVSHKTESLSFCCVCGENRSCLIAGAEQCCTARARDFIHVLNKVWLKSQLFICLDCDRPVPLKSTQHLVLIHFSNSRSVHLKMITLVQFFMYLNVRRQYCDVVSAQLQINERRLRGVLCVKCH